MQETTSGSEQRQKKMMPQSELDLNLMMTDPMWGSPDISQGLKDRLNRMFRARDEKGNVRTAIQSMWDLLGFYTRDMRLANLSVLTGELTYVSYHLDLAHDFLQVGMLQPFLICLSRAATILELSQSKGGFLRRRMHTFSQESIQGSIEPEKKSLFGINKRQRD